jgi:predicted amidophosphoribosyltransferase
MIYVIVGGDFMACVDASKSGKYGGLYFCGKCGAEVYEDDNYCSKCGEPLKWDKQPVDDSEKTK